MKAVITHEQAGFGGCYRVTAPTGYCFGPELHELVIHYEDPAYRRDAWLHALKDRREYPLRACTVNNCEWCNE